jgi:hypothetical protein
MICSGPIVPTQEVKLSVTWRALVCFPKSLGPGADRYICVALAMICSVFLRNNLCEFRGLAL